MCVIIAVVSSSTIVGHSTEPIGVCVLSIVFTSYFFHIIYNSIKPDKNSIKPDKTVPVWKVKNNVQSLGTTKRSRRKKFHKDYVKSSPWPKEPRT